MGDAARLAPVSRTTRRGDLPPHDSAAEITVLVAAMDHAGAAATAREIVSPADFFDGQNRKLYEVMLALDGQGVHPDPGQIAVALAAQGASLDAHAVETLTELRDTNPADRLWRRAAERVRDLALVRREILAAETLAAALRVDDAALTERARADLASVRAPGDSPPLAVGGIFAALEPIRYVVAPLDLCPGAPALFAGYGYSGKTLSAQSMGLAVGTGARVWGCFAAAQGRVLHIDYEQGERLTRERYQRLALGVGVGPSDLGDRLALVSMPRTYLDGMSEDALAARLDGFDLAIIDSLRAACPTIDENDSGVRRVLDLLTRASERTGCVVVVIHHARKPQRDSAGGAKMAIRGSGAIFDACGSVLVFDGEKGQPTRVSHEKARVSGRLVEDFTLTICDAEIGSDPRAGVLVTASAAPSREDAADDARAARQRERTERIAGELRGLFGKEPEQGGTDAIATKLGRKAADVRSALTMLVDAGEVTATGKSRDRRHRWAGRE